MYTIFILNAVIILFYLLNARQGYKKGFSYSVLRLVAFIFTIMFSYKFAEAFVDTFKVSSLLSQDYLVKLQLLNLEKLFNMTCIFIVVFLLLSFLLNIVIRIMNKFIGKIPLVNQFNRLLGVLFSLLTSTIVVVVFSVLLNLPFVPNGKYLQQHSLLAPITKISSKIADQLILKYSDLSQLFNQFIQVVGSEQDSLIQFLKNNKISSKSQFEKLTGISFDQVKNYYQVSEDVFDE